MQVELITQKFEYELKLRDAEIEVRDKEIEYMKRFMHDARQNKMLIHEFVDNYCEFDKTIIF
jgi:hypothetical protein